MNILSVLADSLSLRSARYRGKGQIVGGTQGEGDEHEHSAPKGVRRGIHGTLSAFA